MCMLGSESTKAGEDAQACVPLNLISEAQSRAVDDMRSRKECSTQYVQESRLDIHGKHGIPSVASCRDVLVWTGA